jgi:hypothetical protein
MTHSFWQAEARSEGGKRFILDVNMSRRRGASMITLTVLNPRGDIESSLLVSPAARLNNLAGKNIGILFNGKPGGKMLLPYVEEVLKRRFCDIELQTWNVPFAQAQNAKLPALKELAAYADGVIALLGD